MTTIHRTLDPLRLKVITIKTKVTIVSRGKWCYVRLDGKNRGTVDGQKKGMWLSSRRKAIQAFKANFKKWKF